MGVTIGGVRHEELADPGGGTYSSPAAYNQAVSGNAGGAMGNVNTTVGGGSATPVLDSAGNPAGGGIQGAEAYNNQAAQLQQQAAKDAAYQAYLNKRMELLDLPGLQIEKDKQALAAAQQAYTQKLGDANLTGFTADGKPTFANQQHMDDQSQQQRQYDASAKAAADQFAATQTGIIGGANGQGGTASLAKQLQDANLSGQFNGQDTEAAREYNLTHGLADRTQQSQEAQAMLTLQSQLRGPRNAFQQQALSQGLNATGLSRSVDAIAGRYTPTLGGAEHGLPQGASIGSMVQDMHGNTGGLPDPSTPDGRAALIARYGGNEAAAQQAYAAQQGWSRPQVQAPFRAPGGMAYDGAANTVKPMPFAGPQIEGPDSVRAMGSGPMTAAELAQGTHMAQQRAQTQAGGAMQGNMQYNPYNAQQAQQQGTAQAMQQPNTDINAYSNALVSPNKIVGRNWNQLGTDDKEFLTGAYETSGRSANDLNDAIKRGMPQFKAPRYGLAGG
jgi:hypothetical protein